MVTQDMLRRMANAAAARKLADAEYEKARRAVMAGFRDRVLEPGPLTLREITSVRQHFNLKDVERVLADECLQRFGRPLDGVMGLLYGLEERHRRGRGWGDGRLKDDDRYRVVNFADLSKTLSDKYDILDEKDLNPAERLWLDLCDRAYYLLLDSRWDVLRKTRRRLVVGMSDTADGWTDGETYVAIDRRFLRRLTIDTRGITALGVLLIHEYCHDDADTGTHTHSLEFYEQFHDKCREKLPEFVNGCLTRLPNVLKAAKRQLNRDSLKELDRAAAGRQALEDLLENTKIAAEVDAAAAG